MFTRRQIVALLIPLMLEQVLSGLMGIADTMMVTSVGESAISAVALVDSINTLVLNLLTALAAGGVIVCAQYLGRGETARANDAARQVLLVSLGLSLGLMIFCLALRRPLLSLIFGSVEAQVMDQALEYFLITAVSYPFLAAQQTAAAVFRASGRSAPPMAVAAVANVVNIAGNAVGIFVLHMGVTGAALATTVSRVISAVALLILLRSRELPVSIRDYAAIRPDRRLMGMVLRVGVPTGVENSMFQLGKLVVQSTVSTLGTTAMAAQAMIQTLDSVQSMPSLAIGTGLLTVAGQCMGAGRVDEMKKYTRQFCLYSQLTLMVVSSAVLAATPLVTRVSRMTPESAALTFSMMVLITIARAVLWMPAFTLPNGMRAAGDVRFSATVSALSMWIFRVGSSMVLCRVLNLGLLGVWIAWFCDWVCRGAVYIWRYRSGGWMAKKVIQD
ncbi:MAG: MATE family efflux transporter [Candidatus Enterenecus sp.]